MALTTVKEAAKRLGVHLSNLYSAEYRRRYNLPRTKIQHHIYFDEEDIERAKQPKKETFDRQF